MVVTYTLELYEPPHSEKPNSRSATSLWINFQNHVSEKLRNHVVHHTAGIVMSDICIKTAAEYDAHFVSYDTDIKNERPIMFNAIAMVFANEEDAVEFILRWS